MDNEKKKKYSVGGNQLKKLSQQQYLLVAVPLVVRGEDLVGEYTFEIADETIRTYKYDEEVPLTVWCPGDGIGLAGKVGILQPPSKVFNNKIEIVTVCDVWVVYRADSPPEVKTMSIADTFPVWAIERVAVAPQA